ncbi:hypothetical protein AAMO2058_000688100 [Amorphochlora amoebiformis]
MVAFGGQMGCIRPRRQDFSHDEDFLVNICITNHLKQDRFLMSYGTQFEIPGLLNNIFKCDKSCGFKGPEIEREKIKDFMRLKGQHKSCAKHNIARYLVFPKADIYNIQVTLNAMFIAAETTVEAKSAIGNGIDPSSCQITQATLISKPYTLKVRDGREIMKSIQEHSNHKSSASKEEVKTFHRDEAHSTEFYQCGSDKISALQGAIDKARNFSTDAHASVEDFSHGDTWESIFGDYDVGNHKYTEHVFLNAKLYLSGESYNFHCNGILCQEREDVFAYVYSTDANHVIYVCDRFFSAPNSKVHNSQPGILIHEVTHFNDVGNTLDFAYGLQAVNNLADSNPMKARRNADSYELYAETAGGSDTINDPKNAGFHDFLKSKQAIILCSVIVGGFFITVFCFICCMMCLKSGPRRGEHIPDQSRQVLSASSRRRSKAPERRRTNSRPRRNENKAARYTVDP